MDEMERFPWSSNQHSSMFCYSLWNITLLTSMTLNFYGINDSTASDEILLVNAILIESMKKYHRTIMLSFLSHLSLVIFLPWIILQIVLLQEEPGIKLSMIKQSIVAMQSFIALCKKLYLNRLLLMGQRCEMKHVQWECCQQMTKLSVGCIFWLSLWVHSHPPSRS